MKFSSRSRSKGETGGDSRTAVVDAVLESKWQDRLGKRRNKDEMCGRVLSSVVRDCKRCLAGEFVGWVK